MFEPVGQGPPGTQADHQEFSSQAWQMMQVILGRLKRG